MTTIKRGEFYWSYDPSADVVHVAMQPGAPVYGEELENFENVVILMRDFETNNVVGLRILRARQNGLQAVRVKINRLKRSIEAFVVEGHRPPGVQVDEEYAEELANVARILDESPSEDALLLARS